MLAQGQSSSAKRGGLAADVSSGIIFLKKKKKKETIFILLIYLIRDCSKKNFKQLKSSSLYLKWNQETQSPVTSWSVRFWCTFTTPAQSSHMQPSASFRIWKMRIITVATSQGCCGLNELTHAKRLQLRLPASISVLSIIVEVDVCPWWKHHWDGKAPISPLSLKSFGETHSEPDLTLVLLTSVASPFN